MAPKSWKATMLEALIAHFAASTPDPSRLAFREHPYGSLSMADRAEICPSIHDEGPAHFQTHADTKALFILGAQKAGTTFLHSALSQHPSFIVPRGPAEMEALRRGEKPAPSFFSKEPHFFDRYPLPATRNESFESFFPPAASLLPGQCLLDATPNYLYTAMAAPRIKAMLPNAKFVVVLRDPVMREYSAFQMGIRNGCYLQQQEHPGAPCVHGSFHDMIAMNIEFQLRRHCLFHKAGLNATWGSCFSCGFAAKARELCEGPDPPDPLPEPCTVARYSTLNHGNYATQLSWWFAFFPPSRFLVLLSSELHDADEGRRLALLNRVKEFAGIGGPDFGPEALEKTSGFAGGYDLTHLPLDDVRALLALRLLYRQSLLDLNTILSRDSAHAGFPGIAEEITLAELQSHLRRSADLSAEADGNALWFVPE